jgi:TfoX/Sxy family transcriptional regulator of competence genes
MKKPGARSSETMDYLAERIREIVGDNRHVTEKTMFGGLTFLFDGHILVGCKKDGRILLSVGKEHNAEALARPGATQMLHGDRRMSGFIWVEPDAIEDDDALRDWVYFAYRRVSAMPAQRPAQPRAAARARKTPARR